MTICVCSFRIPQSRTCRKSLLSLSSLRRPGARKWSSAGFQEGQGNSTSANKTALSSSFFSASGDASHGEVPAKDAGVSNLTGTKIMGLMNPISLIKRASSIGVADHYRASVASHVDIIQGHNLCLKNLESYTIMRAGNIGGKFPQLAIEFANNSYIPSILRATSYLENVTMATSIHLGFVNDVFSYPKESLLEQNPRNLITVLMECEGKPFVQTMYMTIDLVNAYARGLMDLEVEAWNSTLENHLQDIKALIAGNVYYSFMDKRYRHPNSVFPELRDMTSSWKILLHVKGLGL